MSLIKWIFSNSHSTSLLSPQRIPADIARLSNLLHLDLSGNKLRSLPAEMGDMLQLRDLRLNNNSLRMLPYELGRLFQLQNLVITGTYKLDGVCLYMYSIINRDAAQGKATLGTASDHLVYILLSWMYTYTSQY